MRDGMVKVRMPAKRAAEGSGTTTLHRPTGDNELALVRESGWSAWPPRLYWQPIFYPVLSFGYARKIARDRNMTGEPNRVGYRPAGSPPRRQTWLTVIEMERNG